MSGVEAIWTFGMLGVLMLGLMIFMRLRRRTDDFAEVQIYKARLPGWVSLTERAFWWALLFGLGTGSFRAFSAVHAITRPGRQVEGADAAFAVVGAGLFVLPAAMLGANAISWLIPPMRSANLHAMAGSNQSFAKANRGLLLAGAVMWPIGLIDLAIAVTEPWAR